MKSVPNRIPAEYRERVGSCLLCDYLQLELQMGERIICENEALWRGSVLGDVAF